MTNKTIEEVVQNHYDQIFNECMKIIGDDMFDIVVEVKDFSGKTIRVSWEDRNKALKEQ